jgi:uncharacterized protein
VALYLKPVIVAFRFEGPIRRVSYKNRIGEMSENQQFERGIAHFNEREFFEAHEVWEEIWLRAPVPEKRFLQGLIQVAAALHHSQRGNSRGTKSLLAAGLAKLGGFPVSYRGIDLKRLIADTEAWLEALAGTADRAAGAYPKIYTCDDSGSESIKLR